MNDDNDHGDTGGPRQPHRKGYRSPRKPKLRAEAHPRPPRLPEPGEEYPLDDFGSAAEDGLRMLAALETMPSLEPDFGDDPSAEAAVTIVEQTGTRCRGPGDRDAASVQNAPRRSLSARLGDVTSEFEADTEYESCLPGPIAEATVEIIEVRREANGSGLELGREPASRRKGRKLPGRA